MISSRTMEMIKRDNRINSNGDCRIYFHLLSLMKKFKSRVTTKKPAMT
jgi:hypothetical protein